MHPRSYSLVCGAVFLLVAAGHLVRLVLGWEIDIGGWHAPTWISIVGLCGAGSLSAWGFAVARAYRHQEVSSR